MFHERYPDLSVELVVDEVALDEYQDDDTGHARDNTVSAYVEATSGSNFGIRLTTTNDLPGRAADAIVAAIFLDGKQATSKVAPLRYTSKHRSDYTIQGVQRMTVHGKTLEKFTFSQLETNDGPVGKIREEEMKDLGEIKVTCTWARERGKSHDDRTRQTFGSQAGSSIPEKCLKGRAISNRASVGAPQIVGGVRHISLVDYPHGKDPFATFIFKYRSRRDLQIEGIIERSPTPVPLEDCDPDDLTVEEARELLRRMRERQALEAPVKKEGESKKRARSTALDIDDSDSDEIIITGESQSRKRSRESNGSAIDIIDLTAD